MLGSGIPYVYCKKLFLSTHVENVIVTSTNRMLSILNRSLKFLFNYFITVTSNDLLLLYLKSYFLYC